MLPLTALKSMKVMFATPCYISAVAMNYVASLFSLTCDAMHVGLDCILHLHSESLITRGRNNIVRKFLSEESFTHLFWIDSDIAFSSDAVFRLLRADRDVAAGVYPMKNFHWPAEGLPAGMTRKEFEERYTEYPFNPIGHGNARVSGYADGDGFVEVDEAPTGFMVIKRHVFSRMMERYPQLRYTPDGPPGHPQAHLHWLFFDCMVHRDRPVSVGGFCLLPSLARDRRQGLGRSRMQAVASRPAHVPRRLGAEPALARPMVKNAEPGPLRAQSMERSRISGAAAIARSRA
jgi:hypothetical protein